MKVKLRTIYAGKNGTIQPGCIGDFPDDVAEQLVDGGYGELVDDNVKVTTEIEEKPAEIEPEKTQVTKPNKLKKGK